MTTYWAARFLAAAELERRRYRVSLKDESAPGFDLSVTNDAGEQFLVNIKGLAASGTPWTGAIIPPRENLFYILVFVAAARNDDRFFILSQSEWNGLIEEYQRTHPHDPGSGFLWDAPHQYEGQWKHFHAGNLQKKRKKA